MKITGLLLKPDLENLKDDFLKLQKELAAFQQPSDFIRELSALVQNGLKEMEQNLFALDLYNNVASPENADPQKFYSNFRRLKLGLHFARRRMRRMISTRVRIQKIQERRSRVSTFAA